MGQKEREKKSLPTAWSGTLDCDLFPERRELGALCLALRSTLTKLPAILLAHTRDQAHLTSHCPAVTSFSPHPSGHNPNVTSPAVVHPSPGCSQGSSRIRRSSPPSIWPRCGCKGAPPWLVPGTQPRIWHIVGAHEMSVEWMCSHR